MGLDECATFISEQASRKQKAMVAFLDTERLDDNSNKLYGRLS
jgi:hypothetical protein